MKLTMRKRYRKNHCPPKTPVIVRARDAPKTTTCSRMPFFDDEKNNRDDVFEQHLLEKKAVTP